MDIILIVAAIATGLFILTILWHGIIGTFKRSWVLALVGFLFLFPIYIFWVMYEAPIRMREVWRKQDEKQKIAEAKKAAENLEVTKERVQSRIDNAEKDLNKILSNQNLSEDARSKKLAVVQDRLDAAYEDRDKLFLS